jgi:hypothetical protein
LSKVILNSQGFNFVADRIVSHRASFREIGKSEFRSFYEEKGEVKGKMTSKTDQTENDFKVSSRGEPWMSLLSFYAESV